MSQQSPSTMNRRGGLQIDRGLDQLVATEILPGTGIDADAFWQSFAEIVRDLGPTNTQLLRRRDELQALVDQWYQPDNDHRLDAAATERHLRSIGYLVPEGPPLTITTDNVDAEIATVAAPQLVVPVNNARYCINAANARWGSLYDALYGTDVIADAGQSAKTRQYNPARGAEVIRMSMTFLDTHVPLVDASWADVTAITTVRCDAGVTLSVTKSEGGPSPLLRPSQFRGFRGEASQPAAVLLIHNGLHIEVVIDRQDAIGQTHPAGIKDVILESAVTTIQDCEDSVAAVDAEDKVVVYRNWLGLMKGTLCESFEKDGRVVNRVLASDRSYTAADGGALVLPGRSLLLVRNVGMHMLTDAVCDADGRPVPEGFLDAMVTVAAAMHDLRGLAAGRNSRTGSVYIVKPKQHGPDEVAATVALFSRVERSLGLPPRTIKIGIMDEERRTTVNLLECLRAAGDRVVFINTGFLDRTGDEIHTTMNAGGQVPKNDIKSAAWLKAYEDWNVDIGLACGLPGRGQIGKGMWPAPDAMAAMVQTKVNHPLAGATCAWVPSPTAATLHAMHYHAVDVAAKQDQLRDRSRASLHDILTPSVLGDRRLTEDQVQSELDNNLQGILGYVVRWIDEGIGCSKVPDIHQVGLMEDRATLRISSQLVANLLHHRIAQPDAVMKTMRRMAAVVDRQNAGNPGYRPMADDSDENLAFQAAVELVFQARQSPCGYTEATLTKFRRLAKQLNQSS